MGGDVPPQLVALGRLPVDLQAARAHPALQAGALLTDQKGVCIENASGHLCCCNVGVAAEGEAGGGEHQQHQGGGGQHPGIRRRDQPSVTRWVGVGSTF